MTEAVDPRLTAALTSQLQHRDFALARGARRVGWKLGVGEAERIGSGPAIGYLTTATVLEPGASFDAASVRALHADVEVVVRFGRAFEPGERLWEAIDGYGAALELVDLGQAGAAPERIVADNVFHRAVAFSSSSVAELPAGTPAALTVNGALKASGTAGDIVGRLRAAAAILASIGERFEAGDRVITGSVVQVPVAPGDQLVADLGPLGAVGLTIASRGRAAITP